MDFNDWLAAKGFDASTLTDVQRAALSAAWRAEQNPVKQPQAPQTATAAPQQSQQEGNGHAGNNQVPQPHVRSLEQIAADHRAEQDRHRKITDLAAQAIRENPDAATVDHLESLAKTAIEQGSSVQEFQLALLKSTRAHPAPIIHRHKPGDFFPQDESIVEAAVCRYMKLPTLEKDFKPDVLEASHRYFKGGLGLQELLLTYARRGGYQGLSVNASSLRQIMQSAFMPNPQAGIGSPSYHTLSGVLSNVANKFVVVAFNAVESGWRQISRVRTVNDFKAITTYALTGDLNFQKIGPGGEIKHGTLGAESYTNRADSFGRMLAITMQDMVNDDLGALQQVTSRLGRGGALKLNLDFWTEFLANAATFWTTARGNYIEGATTNLSQDGLEQGVEAFLKLTDPDGNPLGVMPKFLVVPPEEKVQADILFTSTNVVVSATDSTADIIRGDKNVFQSKYQPIVSSYLSNTNITGNSTTAWFLVADPMDLPTIEVVFLDGVETPVVESSDADFNILGVMMRGVLHFGVAKQEYRASVRSKGAA